MAANSHIEWTEATWNPVTGCTKVSAGCKNCYAERLALRLRAMGNYRYRHGFRVTLHEDVLDLPRTWKTPRRIFVNSMSDLFHPDVPLWFIGRVFQTMEECPQHTFQVLTKRSERVRKLSAKLRWPQNVWMGVSVEDNRVFRRIDGASLRPLPFLRTIDWLAHRSRLARHSLGDRWRGIRPAFPSDARSVGARNLSCLSKAKSAVLFQAMGRRAQRPNRSRARREHVRRNACPGGGLTTASMAVLS